MKKTGLLDNSQELDKIMCELPSNDEVAKDILSNIGNNKTKVVLDNDIKSSYYVDILDTIYISNNQASNYGRVCLIAHECRHSIQSKLLQKLNFISSNIEVLLFLVILVLRVFKIDILFLIISYIALLLFNITIRLFLECDAVSNSTKISYEYLKSKLKEEDLIKIDNAYNTQVKKLMPVFIFKLIYAKILRLVIVLLLNYFK